MTNACFLANQTKIYNVKDNFVFLYKDDRREYRFNGLMLQCLIVVTKMKQKKDKAGMGLKYLPTILRKEAR